MKYEDFKVGDVFKSQTDEETVISKSDKYRIITTINSDGEPTPWTEDDLYFLKPIKEESTLDQVTDAVKEIGNFTIEESPTGLIILTPIKK